MVGLSSCFKKRILLSQPIGVLSSTVFWLFLSSVTAPAIALEWQIENDGRESTTGEQAPRELESQETLNRQELMQALRGLELVEIFNFPSVEIEQVKQVKNDLKEIARQSSSPYQIPQSQLEGLRNIFSSLSEEELTAVNQILLLQQAQTSISITAKEAEILQIALQKLPNQNLSESQRQQLAVMRDALSDTSQQEEVAFSSEKLERLQGAIAQVFFPSEACANENNNIANGNSTNSNQDITQSQRQQFRSNLGVHLTNSNEESRNFLISSLSDSEIPQAEAEKLISSLDNIFQEVEGGEIAFRVEMARRIQLAQETFNQVLGTLETETLEAPPDSLLIIREVIAEAVAATRSVDEEERAGEINSPEGVSDETPSSREDLISQLLIPDPVTEEITLVEDRTTPALGLNVPSGFGTEWGQVFAGAGYQASTRPVPPSTEQNDEDGAFAVGMGFGDPQNAVGLETVYTSLGTFRSGAFSTGSFSFKLHRRLGETSSVAVGVENLIQYGGADGQTSYYGSITNIFNLTEDSTDNFSRLAITAGVGSGRFRQFQDMVEGKDTINFFGSVGLQVAEPVSLLAAYTGQTLTIGASVAPFRNIPLVITPSVTDITGDFIESPRFVITIGYGDRLFNRD